MTPFLTNLLKPSADYLGKELRSYLQSTIEQWKEHRRSENLRHHIGTAAKRMNPQGESKVRDRDGLERMELFEDWVSGAQDVDPMEAELSQIWCELLCEIAKGARPTRLLLTVLRQLDGESARVLLRLRDDRRFRARDSRTAYHMRHLSHLELVEEHNHLWVLAVPVAGVLAVVLSLRLVNPSTFASWQSYGDVLKFFVDRLPALVISVLLLGGLTLSLIAWLPKWCLSWLDKDLVHYAKSEQP